MSYSRWGSRGSGYWYTYWRVPQIPKYKETVDNALFEICGLCQFTAKDLYLDIESCLKVVRQKDKNADERKINELRIYINEFLKDVNDEYSKNK